MIRTAICTGASSGIGEASAKELTKRGFKVIGIRRNVQSLQKLKRQGFIHDYVTWDLTEPNACTSAVKESMAKLDTNTLTTLVNSAGIFRGGEVGQKSLETFEGVFNANVRTVFEMTEQVIPYLRKFDKILRPSIINIYSIMGIYAGSAVYGASKAAVDQLTRCGSVDLAKFGIQVNGVSPGVIRTPIYCKLGMVGEDFEKFMSHTMETQPLAKTEGRIISPEEVADLIYFLASEESKFITGECIAIDGGNTKVGVI
eukprot:maker-scaffold_33-snap-gene-3.78-mRNA-1 protein AED:0.02 eAED:0.02 QI:0/0/0/1/1/1/3/0/256